MRHLTALQTILFKEIHRFMRIWPQTVLPSAVTTSLYFLIFGTLIGRRVGPMAGMSYMDYLVPGVVLMSVITNAYGNVVSSFYSTKFQRHIEELLIAPVPNWIILAGYVGGGVARGLAVGGVVAGIGRCSRLSSPIIRGLSPGYSCSPPPCFPWPVSSTPCMPTASTIFPSCPISC